MSMSVVVCKQCFFSLRIPSWTEEELARMCDKHMVTHEGHSLFVVKAYYRR